MLDFHYKEIDDTDGKATLEAIDKTDHFNEWMYQTIKPFVKERYVEIGSRIGKYYPPFLFEIILRLPVAI